MSPHWEVRIALNSEASAWSSPFGPCWTRWGALRRGRRISYGGLAVRADRLPTDRELLEQIVVTLAEIRDRR